MSNLITLDNIALGFGLEPLLDNIKLQIAYGERVCLIGRNGAGKSSLLKIIEGSLLPDSGDIWRKPHLRIARLDQELPQQTTATVYEQVADGLADMGQLLTAYHALTLRLARQHTSQDLSQLAQMQQALDACNGWQFEQKIKTILNRLDLSPDQNISDLSGGWQRRVALAKALVVDPELLLLDEPTNHLDIETIQWLEDQLLSSGTGLLFITHDRALLQRLATRIIELDRGNLTSWPGDYANFLRRKDELLNAEEKQNSDFDKKLAQEERWIRQGIKARRTRNEGRVRALKALRMERTKRREIQGKVSFQQHKIEQSGHLVIAAEHIFHRYNNQDIIKDFSLRIMRGDRIGLIGPNGIGKSTLLNILLGKLPPQQGTIKHGTHLQIAYFDQLRLALDLEKTVVENVAEGSDTIEINGKKRHIISYLSDFLFTPQRALTPVKALSGGECNRLLLAKLFTRPANVLVLDEPTNDLDIETLELLEEMLCEYQGTLLLVSHDRVFLDNIVTSTLVFNGNGKIEEYIGGYQDWIRQTKHIKTSATSTKNITPKTDTQGINKPKKKLSFNEQRELDNLPQLIHTLEAEQTELQQQMSNPEFYQQDAATITQTMDKLKLIETNLEKAYARWEELENMKSSNQ